MNVLILTNYFPLTTLTTFKIEEPLIRDIPIPVSLEIPSFSEDAP